MSRRTTTLTMFAPYPRRSSILVGDKPMRVCKTSGAGPYMLEVRPITWVDRLLGRMGYRLAAPKRRFRSWQEARWDRQDAEEGIDA